MVFLYATQPAGSSGTLHHLHFNRSTSRRFIDQVERVIRRLPHLPRSPSHLRPSLAFTLPVSCSLVAELLFVSFLAQSLVHKRQTRQDGCVRTRMCCSVVGYHLRQPRFVPNEMYLESLWLMNNVQFNMVSTPSCPQTALPPVPRLPAPSPDLLPPPSFGPTHGALSPGHTALAPATTPARLQFLRLRLLVSLLPPLQAMPPRLDRLQPNPS